MNTSTIIQINSVVNSGSTGHIVEDINEKIIESSMNSIVYYGRKNNNSKAKLYKIGTKTNIFLNVLLNRFFDIHDFFSYFPTKRLIKQLEKESPQIVHLHNIHGYYINYKVLFRWLSRKGIPVVWTLHDCWSFTGHCAFYSFSNCHKWETEECKMCLNKKTYPSCFLFSNSHHNYKNKRQAFLSCKNICFVTPSEWLKEEVESSFFKGYPVYVINNGIDLNIFYPHEKSTSQKKIILGVSNIWEKRKGFDDFIKLSSLLKDDEEIVLIGLSEEQIRILPDNIKGMTRTENQAELAQWYSDALVFVNTTYEDNFPTTNLEALACGTPVITYKTGGSPESIDGETGFAVNQGDVDSLYSFIRKIEQEGKEKYSTACVCRAKAKYDKNKKYQEYIDLYSSILNCKN